MLNSSRLCIALLCAALLALLVAPAARSQAPVHRAGLVVRFSDDRVITRCVEFAEESITSEELLKRSGLRVVYEHHPGLGAAVCKIEDVGCDYPAVPCFCQCQGAECVYWAYYYLDESSSQWVYSGFGVSNRQVHDGDVDGWSWGAGSTSQGTPPPLVPLDQVCAPPATHTPIPSGVSVTPTATPVPPPTATPVPTPKPTAAPKPTVAPEVRFWADTTRLAAGECTTLHWDVEHVDAVYLDGQGVTGHEARPVCPPHTQTYELKTVAGGQESVNRVTIEVAPADTPLPAPSPTAPVPTAQPPTAIPSGDNATPPPAPTISPTASPTPVPTESQPAATAPRPTSIPSGFTVTPRQVAQAGPVPTSAPQPAASNANAVTAPPAGNLADLAAFGLTMTALAGVGAFALWWRR